LSTTNLRKRRREFAAPENEYPRLQKRTANPPFERTRGSVVGVRLAPRFAPDRWRAAQRQR